MRKIKLLKKGLQATSNVTSFITNILLLQIFKIESDDEGGEKPSPRFARTYGDLKLISNHPMLTDTIINSAQHIIHLQHSNIAGLQDTLLSQSFHSKDVKDQKSFHFKKLFDQPFVQVLHDGIGKQLIRSTVYLVKFF